MSNRTSISIYLDGMPIDVIIYPYDLSSGLIFFYETIRIAAALDGITDIKSIRRWCHINRGFSSEKADAFCLREISTMDLLESERICDGHYIVDLTSRCIYSCYPQDFEKPSCLPLEILKTKPKVSFGSLQKWQAGVIWFDSINLEYIRQELVEKPWQVPDCFDYDSCYDDDSIKSIMEDILFEEGRCPAIDLEDLLPQETDSAISETTAL